MSTEGVALGLGAGAESYDTAVYCRSENCITGDEKHGKQLSTGNLGTGRVITHSISTSVHTSNPSCHSSNGKVNVLELNT